MAGITFVFGVIQLAKLLSLAEIIIVITGLRNYFLTILKYKIMSNILKAVKTMANIQENSEGVEQLTSEELEAIEGGTNISCQISNTSCKPKQE